MDKKLYEELLVIRHYVRRYYAANKVVIEANPSNEAWDARIYTPSGDLIEHVEVTLAHEQDAHKDRLIMAGKWRDSETGAIKRGFDWSDHSRQMATFNDTAAYSRLAIDAINKKRQKTYPPNTTLVVSLSADMICEDAERFTAVVGPVLEAFQSAAPFRRIVVVDHTNSFCREIKEPPTTP